MNFSASDTAVITCIPIELSLVKPTRSTLRVQNSVAPNERNVKLSNQAWNGLSKMFHNDPCSMPDLSWNVDENPFAGFSLTGNQADRETNRQTDRQTHQQRWRYNLCRFMGVIMIFFEFLATETNKNITQNVISCIKLVYFIFLSLFWHRYGQCTFHLMNGTMTFYLKVFIRSRIPVVSRTLIGWIVSTHLRKKQTMYGRTDR